MTRKLLAGDENSDINFDIRFARASIPSNPNTIFNVGNLEDPVMIFNDVPNT